MPDAPDPIERRRLEDYRLKKLEEGVAELWRHVDSRFDGVHVAIGQLQFVRQDVYTVEKVALKQEIDEAKDIATNAKAIAMWALGLLCSAVVVAVIGFVTRIS